MRINLLKVSYFCLIISILLSLIIVMTPLCSGCAMTNIKARQREREAPARARAKFEAEQKREREKQATIERMNKIVEQREAELKSEEDKIKAWVQRHGYRAVNFDTGLTLTIWAILDHELPLDLVIDVVIQLDNFRDDELIAIQVFDGGALYATELGEGIVMCFSEEPQFEGGPLNKFTSYVVFDGVTTYESVLGSRQAFVVRPVWIDLEML